VHASQRQLFNKGFSSERYTKLKELINAAHDHTPAFRISETPIFLTPELRKQLLEACEEIS